MREVDRLHDRKICASNHHRERWVDGICAVISSHDQMPGKIRFKGSIAFTAPNPLPQGDEGFLKHFIDMGRGNKNSLLGAIPALKRGALRSSLCTRVFGTENFALKSGALNPAKFSCNEKAVTRQHHCASVSARPEAEIFGSISRIIISEIYPCDMIFKDPYLGGCIQMRSHPPDAPQSPYASFSVLPSKMYHRMYRENAL